MTTKIRRIASSSLFVSHSQQQGSMDQPVDITNSVTLEYNPVQDHFVMRFQDTDIQLARLVIARTILSYLYQNPAVDVKQTFHGGGGGGTVAMSQRSPQTRTHVIFYFKNTLRQPSYIFDIHTEETNALGVSTTGPSKRITLTQEAINAAQQANVQ